MLKIVVRQAEDVLFHCQWIDGFDHRADAASYHPEGVVRLLAFSGIVPGSGLEIRRGGLLDLCYSWDDISLGVFEVETIRSVRSDLAGTTRHALVRVYQVPDILSLRILKAWSDGCFTVEWKDLDSREAKSSWLIACSVGERSALYARPPSLPAVVSVDLRRLHTQEDFFCALGEAVMGTGGYVGQDPAGMYDCLGQLLSERADRIRFVFSGHAGFDDQDMPFFRETKRVIEDLGCEVVLADDALD
ncbi:hypothetical protein [Xanthomonas medicagonis]|uniref:hypothetical protein n=1 Tax=Xanthomonas medicagonis TaxID=3160841 RepID=UPI0035110DD4